jgi:hypothetical protein
MTPTASHIHEARRRESVIVPFTKTGDNTLPPRGRS